jgi:hypothetical protein
VGNRTKIARTRLSLDEHAQFEAKVKAAGVTESEYLRKLIVSDVASRLESLESRVLNLETQVAQMWAEGT